LQENYIALNTNKDKKQSRMFTIFETYIKEHANVTEDDINLMRSKAIERRLRQKEFLLHQGEVCRYKVFIAKGLLRTYAIRDQGSEHIMRFSPENSWTTEPESFENASPSVLNIDALEPSELVLWTKNDLRYLIDSITGLKDYFDKLISGSGSVLRQRILNNISSSAEEKYEDFIKKYPDIYARVPLHMVASYLGVTRKTLTRIRHAQVKSK
jgi:CRP-like cAMP-binding protein